MRVAKLLSANFNSKFGLNFIYNAYYHNWNEYLFEFMRYFQRGYIFDCKNLNSILRYSSMLLLHALDVTPRERIFPFLCIDIVAQEI